MSSTSGIAAGRRSDAEDRRLERVVEQGKMNLACQWCNKGRKSDSGSRRGSLACGEELTCFQLERRSQH